MKLHLNGKKLRNNALSYRNDISFFWYYVLLFFLTALPRSISAQAPAKRSTFHPIAEHTYGIKEGLPEECITGVLVDKNERLHLSACQKELTGVNSHLYQYDGNRTYPTALELKYEPWRIVFSGTDAANRIFGYYIHQKKDGTEGSVAFVYDQVTKQTESFDLNEMEIGRISDMVVEEECFFVLGRSSNHHQYKILKIQHGEISLRYQIDLGHRGAKLAVTDNDFWVASPTSDLYRINRKDGTQRPYLLPGEGDYSLLSIKANQNDVWIIPSNTKGVQFGSHATSLYLWDSETDSFFTNPHKPMDWKNEEIVSANLAKDSRGNLMIAYWHKNKAVSATLRDENHNLHDYSPVMGEYSNMASSDFKQNIVFYSRSSPIRFVEVATHNAIKKAATVNGPRDMVELDAQTIWMGREVVLSYDEGEWREARNNTCLSGGLLESEKEKDDQGHIWFNLYAPFYNSQTDTLLRYDPVQERCDTFDVGFYTRMYDFMADGQMVLAGRKDVYLWDHQKGSPRLLVKDALRKPPNQVFVSRDGMIWIATNQGLLRIDAQTGIQQEINPIVGQITAVLHLHEDRKGRLWLATIGQGVVVFDPVSGDRQTIKRANGLSHNTVVSLLEDEDGDIWAGTFYGITVLSPDGSIIGTLYEENGLANNECNRWSAMKMNDGRLCIGAIGGVTIIDPIAWKADLKSHSSPHIQLTGIYSDLEDKSTFKKDHLSFFEQNKRIVLPANNRNLIVSYHLSNFASPEKNTFAYQIEGIDKEWNYIGNQHQLSLNALPAGSYNLLIKGKGPRGNWSSLPIIIPLQVRTYFYQQWWFFALCALPFILFLLLWQYRQQGERKRLELKVKNRTATIREQADKLLEADQMKSRLYTNITHEFRTPLTVITGMTDLIEEDPVTAKQLIKRNSKGLLRLVNQILDLAKLESGHLQLELKQADILPYIQYLFESFESFAAGKNIQLFFQKEEEEVIMDFDEKSLESILSNLLSNAIKFTPKGGKVDLKVGKTTQGLSVEITDTGIGILPEKRPYIFDRFYQVDGTSTRKGEGTGIGLALTKELVELMGGQIAVQSPSPAGSGTMFTVILPIRQQAPLRHAKREPAVLLPFPSPAGNQSTPLSLASEGEELPLLLLIEDNADVAIYIQSCLRNRYTVEWAVNGAIGIEKALEMIPDIIISDVMMPEKDGFEVCQVLKNDERSSHIPIVLLTAKADVDSKLEGLGVGADAYLSKPFLKEELYIRLEQLVALRRKLQEKYATALEGVMDEDSSPTEPTLEHIFLQKIHDLVVDNLSDAAFGNEQLAQNMLLSQSQLFRKLKALTGRSVAVYIRSIRLQKGKELLQNSELTVAEVAYECGFTDPAYFSRTFSKEFGEAPSFFIKN